MQDWRKEGNWRTNLDWAVYESGACESGQKAETIEELDIWSREAHFIEEPVPRSFNKWSLSIKVDDETHHWIFKNGVLLNVSGKWEVRLIMKIFSFCSRTVPKARNEVRSRRWTVSVKRGVSMTEGEEILSIINVRRTVGRWRSKKVL